MESRPNVIWIVSDQHRAQALSINGDPNLSTPNMDILATTGVNFTHAVSGFPLCCPFRGSMLTSRYPHKCVPGHEFPLPDDQLTIADVFNDNGYHTAYYGKWHLDGFNENKTVRAAMHIVPEHRRGGFKHWLGYDNNNSQWDCWVHGGEGDNAFHYRLPGYETDVLTDLFIDYLKEQAQSDEPFFGVLSVQPPHNPYVAPAEFMQKHRPAEVVLRDNVPNVDRVVEKSRRELAGYYAQIENLDWNIGRVIETLKEFNLSFNTHIIYFSDHGDMHGSHGQFLKMTPHEEATRIPFIMSGEIPQGYKLDGRKSGNVDVPISHVDIAPTTLGLCGIDKPCWMEGTDYSHHRIIGQENIDPDSAYLQSVVPTGHGNSVDKPWRGLVTKDGWKYACFANTDWLLFNLNEDPYEQVNLAHNSIYDNKKKQLKKRLKQWITDTEDSFQLPE